MEVTEPDDYQSTEGKGDVAQPDILSGDEVWKSDCVVLQYSSNCLNSGGGDHHGEWETRNVLRRKTALAKACVRETTADPHRGEYQRRTDSLAEALLSATIQPLEIDWNSWVVFAV
jgi:hypothetical protein